MLANSNRPVGTLRIQIHTLGSNLDLQDTDPFIVVAAPLGKPATL